MPAPETLVGFDGSAGDTFLIVMARDVDGHWRVQGGADLSNDWVAEQVADIFDRAREPDRIDPGHG